MTPDVIVIALSVPEGGRDFAQLLALHNPRLLVFLSQLIAARLELVGVGPAEIKSPGVAADGLLWIEIKRGLRNRALKAIKQTLADVKMTHGAEIAWMCPDEVIWRHYHPEQAQGDFSRHLTKEALARRELWNTVWQEELERVKKEVERRPS